MQDSPGNDIRNLPGASLTKIAAACNKNALCIGFNSKGLIKSKLLPSVEWQKWTVNPCLGLYSKISGNALLIDILVLLMCKTFLGNTKTWPDVAFFPSETRVEWLEYRLPSHVSLMICYRNCNSYSMSLFVFRCALHFWCANLGSLKHPGFTFHSWQENHVVYDRNRIHRRLGIPMDISMYWGRCSYSILGMIDGKCGN